MPPPHQLRAALETLLSPLGASAPEAWQDSVCERLRELSSADVVFFRLSDRGPSRIDPAGPLPARDMYRRQFRGMDPWPRLRLRPDEARVRTHERLVGPRRLRHDPYYNEFMRPYGVSDYVGIQVGITPEVHAHVGAFSSGRSRGTERAGETARWLSLVLPALRSGLAVWWAAQGTPGSFASALDDLEDALLLYEGGKVAHANRALVELCSRDPEQAALRRALERVAGELEEACGGSGERLMEAARPREIGTSLGTYGVRVVAADPLLLPRRGILLRVAPSRRRAEEAASPRGCLRLTRREAEVARLLAAGRDNSEIAEALGIGATTARNHTARVLRKLGVRSRAQVHAVLHP